MSRVAIALSALFMIGASLAGCTVVEENGWRGHPHYYAPHYDWR